MMKHDLNNDRKRIKNPQENNLIFPDAYLLAKVRVISSNMLAIPFIAGVCLVSLGGVSAV